MTTTAKTTIHQIVTDAVRDTDFCQHLAGDTRRQLIDSIAAGVPPWFRVREALEALDFFHPDELSRQDHALSERILDDICNANF